MYKVAVNNEVVKEYPFKIQAVIYCFMHGYVSHGYDEWNGNKELVVLDERVKVYES